VTAIEDELNTVLARAETIRPGDLIVLPGHLGDREVLWLEEYEDDTIVVVYDGLVFHCWENRAQDKGRWSSDTDDRVERSLKPLKRGERYPTKRRLV
jgi:hypothetical protein